MKKKGFTLIELLAVIVILAIIALIAMPIVLKLIEKTRIGAAESDAYAYARAVETEVVAYMLNSHSENIEGVYEVSDTKGTLKGLRDLTEKDLAIKLDNKKLNGLLFVEALKPSVKGRTPDIGTIITIGKKGKITNVENMIIGGYLLSYENEKFKVVDKIEGYEASKKMAELELNTVQKETSIQVTVITDESNVKIKEYKYYINGELKEKSSNNTHTFTELKESTSYSIQVIAIGENGGNKVVGKTLKTLEKLSKPEIILSDSDKWTISKNATITYKGKFINKVVIENGTAEVIEGTIKTGEKILQKGEKYEVLSNTLKLKIITNNVTIVASSISGEIELPCNPVTIGKIDPIAAKLEVKDSEVIAGESNNISNYYTATFGEAGGTVTCKNGDDVITNISNFNVTSAINNYSLNCEALGNNGTKVSKNLKLNVVIKGEFDYKGSEQIFTIPVTGTYKLEVWGAQGGSYNSGSYHGGYGGYSTGKIKLSKGQKIYINIGQEGINCNGSYYYKTTICESSYNGGGSAAAYFKTYENYSFSGSGGGATHMALSSGLLSSLSSKTSTVLIVAGGGGGSLYYRADTRGNGSGGSAGGYIGSNASSCGTTYGGTQSSGGATNSCSGSSYSTNGSFGQGGKSTLTIGAGGGGGFYGGAGAYYSVGAGGSGYIGNNSLTDKAMYCYNCATSNDTNTKTISTTNVSNDALANYAKQGNGSAKITLIATN